MTTLQDEFLTLLESSEAQWTTLYMEGRTWIHREIPSGSNQPPGSGVGAAGGEVAQRQIPESDDASDKEARSVRWYAAADASWQMWASKHERRVTYSDIEGPVDVVSNGSKFWSNAFGRSYTNGGRDALGHSQAGTDELIETTRYGELLQVLEISPGTKLGRRTLDVRATIRADKYQSLGRKGHHMAWASPDFVELSFDCERGILLSVASFKDGSAYRIVETTRCEFDIDFTPDVFKIEPTFSAGWSSD